MTCFSDEVLKDMENLFTVCNHILEENIPDQGIDKMKDQVIVLRQQSEDYKKNLLDQENNSKSDVSREMASLLLTEDRKLEDLIERDFPSERNRLQTAGSGPDMNVGALYVEYLTGRAMQSIREALVGAMNLKILSKRTDEQLRE